MKKKCKEDEEPKQTLKMSYIDWDKIKREVDIEQYFLFRKGGEYVYDKSKSAYVIKNQQSGGDIIRFFKHSQSGIKMYYSFIHQDSGDIIQFIKKRILNNNASALEINEEIKAFTGNYFSSEKEELQKRSPVAIKSVNKKIDFEINGDIIPNFNQHFPYLENYRRLSISSIQNDLFKDVFFHYRTGSIESLGFYLKNIDGNIIGINRIQTQEGKYFNQKRFDKNSENNKGFTFSSKNENTETLSIFESIFDAISFYELYPDHYTQYVSTNGELSFRKAQLIKQYFEKNTFKKLILGNDNDLAGHNFNLNIISSFISPVCDINRTNKYICITIIPASSEVPKINALLQFFKKSERKYELDDQLEIPQSYFTETLSQNETKYFFMIGNTISSIEFFIHLLFRIWNFDSFITIKTPNNKDFNEDLIKLKANKNG